MAAKIKRTGRGPPVNNRFEDPLADSHFLKNTNILTIMVKFDDELL